MTERTLLAFGRSTFSVPRFAKRGLQVLTAVGLTALVAFLIIMANSLLLGRGVTPGFDIWYGFIRRPEIIGSMILTAAVTIAYLFWEKNSNGGGKR